MRCYCRVIWLCSWASLSLLLVTRFIFPRSEECKQKVVSSLEEALAAGQPSEWDLVMEERKQLLSSVCKNDRFFNLTRVPIDKFVLDRIFYSDKHKILFCQTPKVGNTQWKKVLMVLNGGFPSVDDVPEELVHDHEKNGLRCLSSLSTRDIIRRLNTYFKFLVVRDPFERLISTYVGKFVMNSRVEPWYKEEIAPEIIDKYRKSRLDSDLVVPDLRFDDFVRYLGDEDGRRDLDHEFGSRIIHWTTYAELCAPCSISYDVIGHHETLERDAPYILRAAGVEQLVAYPHIPPGITLYNQTRVERYFSGISTADIRRLYARFQGDFHLFGYPIPDFLVRAQED